ncbi:CobW family GTP-binding protein [Desulfatitalea alkaliphila]|uniref:GTP-binding protein n=1 Tax=Desulfatitalea alkaliphila TaxID=2929485 RepID=A0AA41UIJ5_9BACT|nr:GTP-binding protein [Desulfatitalea alkaliphila]MCJ8499617.1 GTP-binding protein [Desulfatitalea alkaliphila]
MPEHTDVYLITGFLGAGKTTFLNRVIERFPKDRKLTLLVNEFGEIGVDGTLVEGEDLDIMEISKGSIFCVCVKTDFIKGLYQLCMTVRPDVLLIESTGVANPSDLKKDLQLPIFKDRFHLKEQFCIIDAAHFLDAFEVYASLEKQIASSTVFLINKVDSTTAETIAAVKAVIEQFHPAPRFLETSYANIPMDAFFDFASKSEVVAALPEDGGSQSNDLLSEAELDQYLDALLDSPDLQITPPDLLVSVAYRWTGKQHSQIEAMANALTAKVLRAKGFLESEGRMLLFNFVLGDWTIEPVRIPTDRIQHKNVVVFIGPPETTAQIESATRTGSWEGLGIYQPYSSS